MIPLAGSIVDDGSLETDEEHKYRDESRKILELPGLAGHLHLRAGARSSRATARRSRRRSAGRCPSRRRPSVLAGAPGVALRDVPTPLEAAGTDPSLRGPPPRDRTRSRNGLSLFVVGDNLRKGAALNAVQIAEALAAA